MLHRGSTIEVSFAINTSTSLGSVPQPALSYELVYALTCFGTARFRCSFRRSSAPSLIGFLANHILRIQLWPDESRNGSTLAYR